MKKGLHCIRQRVTLNLQSRENADGATTERHLALMPRRQSAGSTLFGKTSHESRRTTATRRHVHASGKSKHSENSYVLTREFLVLRKGAVMEIKEAVLAELKELGGVIEQLKTKSGADTAELQERVSQIETRISRPTAGLGGDGETKSIGEIVVSDEQTQLFLKHRTPHSPKILVGDFFRKGVIVSSVDTSPLPYRVSQVQAAFPPMRLRDAMRVTPVSGTGSVEFIRESSHTNAAAAQGKASSPVVIENIAKAESALSFQLINNPISTIATWVACSRQILDDSQSLKNFLNSRLLHFLAVAEEDALLNGLGPANGDIDGLLHLAAAYVANSPVDSPLDTLRFAIEQIASSGFSANAVVLSPHDWAKIETAKAQTSGEYLMSPNPRQSGPPSVWGIGVVESVKIAVGEFLVGDFQTGCELFDRQAGTIEVSLDHASFRTSNMALVLAEMRETLCTYNTDAFRQGQF